MDVELTQKIQKYQKNIQNKDELFHTGGCTFWYQQCSHRFETRKFGGFRSEVRRHIYVLIGKKFTLTDNEEILVLKKNCCRFFWAHYISDQNRIKVDQSGISADLSRIRTTLLIMCLIVKSTSNIDSIKNNQPKLAWKPGKWRS